MVLRGKAHVFGDNINTDYIISGKYKFKTLDMDELATHLMEDIDPGFASRIQKGDFIVAGRNFGCGSSREQAPLVIRHAGISAVIAKSFARIFYRNAMNIGLFLFEADTAGISTSDELEVEVEKGRIVNLTKNTSMSAAAIPPFLIEIAAEGGVVEYLKRHGGFHLAGDQGGRQ